MSLLNSFGSKVTLNIEDRDYTIYRVRALQECGVAKVLKLPYAIRILLENLLRNEDGKNVTRGDIENLANWSPSKKSAKEIAFTPARVLLQDFTGVPAVVDLAAMREAMVKMNGDPKKINPLQPVDLVIDHSVQTDFFGTPDSFRKNGEKEFERNVERYQFLKWGQKAFNNFRVVPPATGIIHQVNLEHLSPLVFRRKEGGKTYLYPDTLVGTDSHTTMINGLGVLGWGVGGIEAEAAMLGQPVSMLIPEVIGFKLTGKTREGVTITDVVLTVTQMLRKKGVVGKIVEYFGDGVGALSLADRAVISNMAPEYGATAGYFPVDEETIRFLRLTGRNHEAVDLAEVYFKEQGLFRENPAEAVQYSDILELDLKTVESSLAGPRRPQDRIALKEVKASFEKVLPDLLKGKGVLDRKMSIEIEGQKCELENGAVVIASITSCTNTSAPSAMLTAGLVAEKAILKGLMVKPWVKTSLAPGSQVVTDYLRDSGLLYYFEKLRFHLTGYGCMTCIGNSGPLPEPVSWAIKEGDLVAASVLSGNRNFEGRVHPQVKANYLASPALVVAYAIAGTVLIDMEKDPLGKDKDGKPVFLKDIWPTAEELREAMNSVKPEMYKNRYKNAFEGNEAWKALVASSGDTFEWDRKSLYVKHPPYFQKMPARPSDIRDIRDARVLAVLGDSITTDHISPAGSIKTDSPAGEYLIENGVDPKDFNSYGARRGNHEVMVRGTFANIRLKNLMIPGVEGGMTKYFPERGRPSDVTIYDASVKYQERKVPLVVIAGKEYGSGSSRDWAAKGPALLGVKAVIAESFERIHRSNLIGMGILPLQFIEGESAASLKLSGEEVFAIEGIADQLSVGKILSCTADRKTFKVICRIDTPVELEYYRHGGILQYVLRQLLKD
ncbi:MAG TPA: aconitate hydratase AcnA [Candidatus Omnitrophota bacterium]|jgi:aconitate hydratase|nr:MAG: Aconitate hydratase [Candidatus Omnitrophica bacterium ADurb.Bin314]HOE69074.1 aconitate hydratase AcnA [Candidatus Omnitrophota bacterium]HQB94123.1 aconitate hydratase AcnA [Candidatus Omnitrophota bacterium]